MKHNQLVILTTRPTLLGVLRKALAARIERRTWHWHTSPQHSHVWQCLDAARENLRLARWILNMASWPRNLLTPIMYNVFDAAVVVLLHELLADPADTNTNHDDNTAFAIDFLEGQATTSSRISLPGDGARVLRDIKTLVNRMLNHGLGGTAIPGVAAALAHTSNNVSKRNMSVSQVAPSPAIYDVGFILNPEIPPETPAPAPAHPSVNTSSHSLFTKLSSWISNDEHHVDDSYSTY